MQKAKEPSLRFGISGAEWEQDKLGNLLSHMYNGQTPSRAVPEYWNGNINWISSGELNRGVLTKTIEKISTAGKNNANLQIVPKGTFVMSMFGLEAPMTRGNCSILGIDTTINQAIMALFPDESKLTTAFLFQWYLSVGNEYGVKYTQGTKQQNLNAELIKDFDITYPSIVEQKRISGFLGALDALIVAQEKRCEALIKIKKSLMFKMFPQKGCDIPEIRFKGFESSWEETPLSDYLTVSEQRNTDGRYGVEDVLSVSGDYGVVNQIDFLGRSYAGESVLNYKVVSPEDVIYTKSPLKANPYGIIKSSKEQEGIVSVLYGVYHPNEKVDSCFVQTYFSDGARLNNYLRPLVNKGAKNTLLISDEDALRGMVVFPSKEEQLKIGAFFNQIDNVIELNRTKLKSLSHLKSALIKKMFL